MPFIVLTAPCFILAAALISVANRMVYALTIVASGVAVIGYAGTHLVDLPMLGDDVGNWGEPLRVVSIATESAAALLVHAARLPSRARSGEAATAVVWLFPSWPRKRLVVGAPAPTPLLRL